MFKNEELSIVFTTRNTLELLKPAIDSFLDLYPQYKECIYVYDDESTDGTIEWVRQEGLKLLTNKNLFVQAPPSCEFLHRFNHIIYYCMREIKTKYIMFSDNDVLYFKGGLLELYYQYIQEGNKVICPTTKVQSNLIYRGLIPKNKWTDTLYKNNELLRFHIFNCLFDLDYLKSKSLLYDSLYDNLYNKYLSGVYANNRWQYVFDSGLDFLYKCAINKVPYIDSKNIVSDIYSLEDTKESSYIFHWCLGATRKLQQSCYSNTKWDLDKLSLVSNRQEIFFNLNLKNCSPYNYVYKGIYESCFPSKELTYLKVIKKYFNNLFI